MQLVLEITFVQEVTMYAASTYVRTYVRTYVCLSPVSFMCNDTFEQVPQVE